KLYNESLIAAHLLAGQPEAALEECSRRLVHLKGDGQSRSYWLTEELRIRALLALHRWAEARTATDEALRAITPPGWRPLEWRLRASRATALRGLGDDGAEGEFETAVNVLKA